MGQKPARARAGRRRKGEPPAYRLHRAKGLAYCYLHGKQVYLGKYNSPDSRRRYKQIVNEWMEAQTRAAELPTSPAGGRCTIADLVARHARHARLHYRRPDGSVTEEVAAFDLSCRPLLADEYAGMSPNDFRPRHLKAIREAWIEAGLSRKTVNKQVGRIRRVFRWGVEEEMVSEDTAGALTMVRDLAAGRTPARDNPPVEPVPDEILERTVAELHPILRTMIEVQLACGARPGEVCRMRPCEIDRRGIVKIGRRQVQLPAGVWVFAPDRKKVAGATDYILGPHAQEVLAPFLVGAKDDDFLFSPAAVTADRHAERRRRAVTHKRNQQRVEFPARTPSDCYDTSGYGHAVRYACRRAGLKRADWWSPNQLRHNFLTRLDRAAGIQLASLAVGHKRVSTTEVYVERNLLAVAELQARLG